MTDVTRILNAIEQGDAKAADELLPLVYEELRLLAAQKLSQGRLRDRLLRPASRQHTLLWMAVSAKKLLSFVTKRRSPSKSKVLANDFRFLSSDFFYHEIRFTRRVLSNSEGCKK